MKTRFPLSLKILFWALLNLFIVAIIFILFFQFKYGAGLETLVGINTKKRITELAQIVANQLASKPQSEWNSVLKYFGEIYEVKLYLFRCNGAQVAGEPLSLSQPIIERLSSIRGGGGMGGGRGAGRGAFWMSQQEFREPLYFYYHDSESGNHWLGIRMFNLEKFGPQGGGIALLVNIDSIYKSSLFDVRPLFITSGMAILISLLLWIPFLHNVTKAIKITTIATEKISQGDFSAKVNLKRKDELGVLGDSVNKLAERLEGFIQGQKRFLGDVSHELCSPLARVEMALGILEQKIPLEHQDYINDIREDLSHMSNLIKELLSYSKIGLKEKDIDLRTLKLSEIIGNAVELERVPDVTIKTDVPENIVALGNAELLERAFANLIRNAVQYAGKSGPVEITARYENENVVVSVSDHGPGVPENELQKIFDPFYRVEQSRSRDHGGMGLGLAIVRAAVNACKGSVVARNRLPHGLIVEVKLLKADRE